MKTVKTKAIAAYIWPLVAACSGSSSHDLGQVFLEITDMPGLNALAGGCLPLPLMHPAEVETLSWAPGAQLSVFVSLMGQQGCRGNWLYHTDYCPPVHWEFRPTDPDVWRLTSDSSVVDVRLTAVGPGRAGFNIRANSTDFTPFYANVINTAVSISVEQATGIRPYQVTPAAISQIRLARGEVGFVAVSLHDESGNHVCGYAPMTVTLTPSNVASIRRRGDGTGDYVNAPYEITAGNSVGEVRIDFVVGAMIKSLRVIIE